GNVGLREIRTGNFQSLTNRGPLDGQAYTAVFSPDGTRLAYSWFEDSGVEIRVVDTRTKEDTLLYTKPGVKYCEVDDWSMDGSRVLANISWEDASQIAVISLADRSVQFPLAKGTYGNAGFAPDGAHIVFSAPKKEEDI